MRLTPSTCPKCGADALKIIERVYLESGLLPPDANGDMEFESSGGSEILWDSMQTEVIGGNVTVRCRSHHRWKATFA